MARALNEVPANRYSFVCNALIAVSRETDNDRLNDLSIMCAEFNAHCNALSAEWLGAFIALCGSSNEGFYSDLPEHIDIQKVSIHNSLAVFVSILVGKYCDEVSLQSSRWQINPIHFCVLRRRSSTLVLSRKICILRGTAGAGECRQSRP